MRRRDFLAGLLLTATMPHAQAQQPAKVYRIAIVSSAAPTTDMNETGKYPAYRGLFSELRRLGYVEGQNLVVERYSAEGRTERYAELARNVVRSSPDVIFTVGARMVLPSRQPRQQFRSPPLPRTQSPSGSPLAWRGRAATSPELCQKLAWRPGTRSLSPDSPDGSRRHVSRPWNS